MTEVFVASVTSMRCSVLIALGFITVAVGGAATMFAIGRIAVGVVFISRRRVGHGSVRFLVRRCRRPGENAHSDANDGSQKGHPEVSIIRFRHAPTLA